MRAAIVDDLDTPAGREPGAIELRDWDDALAGIAFRCPCGCGYDAWAAGQRPRKGPWLGLEQRSHRSDIDPVCAAIRSALPLARLSDAGEWKEC